MFKWFGSSKESSDEAAVNLNWSELTSMDQLGQLIEESFTRKVVIFKHSTRCGISRMALRQFEKSIRSDLNASLYYLDLIAFRDISNEVAGRFGILHHSPQVLLIDQGEAIYTASHGQIDGEAINQLVGTID